MLLAIDTSSQITHIALFKDGKVLREQSWPSEQNEAEKLMPEILKLVPNLKEIKQILAIKGPGSFTGLRVGIVVANTLTYLLKTELYTTDTFTIWQKRLPENKDATLLIKAGKKEVYFNGEIISIEGLQVENFFGDLTPGQKEQISGKFIEESKLKSFAEVVAALDINKLEKVKVIKPNYVRKPQITKSKNKWKN